MLKQSEEYEEAIDKIQLTIEDLLDMMGIVASAEYKEDALLQEVEREPKPLVFDVDCANPGILIGRAGQTLDCLQYLIRYIVSHKIQPDLPPIVIDVSGYKQRRYQFLRDLAQRIANQVAESGNPFTLEPMSAYERRIIHNALNDDRGLLPRALVMMKGVR